MSQLFLHELEKNMPIDGFLRVKTSDKRTASNGGKFIDMTLADAKGEINAKMWDPTVEAPKPGCVMRVRGVMLEFNGKPQLRIDKMRDVTEEDEIDLSVLVPVAPFAPEYMLAEVRARAQAIENHDLRSIALYLLDEAGDKLLYYPAAKSLHHAERSGLLHHTMTMLRTAEAILPIYQTLNSDLLYAGIIIHDICKISELNSDTMGLVSDYTAEGLLIGHIAQGVVAVAKAGDAVNADPKWVMLLQHMELAHHDLPEYGSPRRPMFAEAEVLHTLDLLDARMNEMSYHLGRVKPGGFTDKVWSLERKLYRFD